MYPSLNCSVESLTAKFKSHSFEISIVFFSMETRGLSGLISRLGSPKTAGNTEVFGKVPCVAWWCNG